MDVARHLEILRTEGERLAAMPADALDAPVPTVEGWTLEDVVRHTGQVHHWVRALLDLPPDAGLGDAGDLEGIPRGPDSLPAYRNALDALVTELARRDPQQQTVAFIGPVDVAWWARRQAHETSVHRIDAADAVHAAGGPAPAPLAVDSAADGVDEWARVFVAVRREQKHGPFPAELEGRTVHLHGTDDPAPSDGAEWLLSFGADGVHVDAVHAKGDVALRGPAADLLLAVWHRRPLDGLEVFGDADLAQRVLDLVRI